MKLKKHLRTKWIKLKKYLIKKLGGVHMNDIPVKKEVEYISSSVKPFVVHGVYRADPHIYQDSANYRKQVMETLEKELLAYLQEKDGCIQIEVDEHPDIFTGKLIIRASMRVLPYCEVGKNGEDA